jgi:CRISPR-associated protein Csh1
MTTFASKKPFLSHQTSFFKKGVNTRLTDDDALSLKKFEILLANKVLPSPILPIFIDKSEFKNNSEIVSIFNNEGERKFSYPQLLKKIYEKEEQRVLGNYYLLNISRGVVNDFDFVSSFQYKLDLKIENIFRAKPKGEEIPTINIRTIFGFENNIATKIFNNALVTKYGDKGFGYKYFDEIKVRDEDGGNEIANLILRFRKAFYDYIYKSRKQAITSIMFDEIMWVSIVSDIKQDEYKDNYHTKETSIKEKLNIWFNLRNSFNNNKNSKNMVNQTVELTKKLRSIIKNDDQHIATDEEFAFASGQIIYKLLLQSESSNKTHAMLEPFLQKREIGLFKSSILKTYETYKHAFKIYPVKYGFDKIIGEVLGGKSVEMNMREFMTLVIAGFFSPSIFKEETNN